MMQGCHTAGGGVRKRFHAWLLSRSGDFREEEIDRRMGPLVAGLSGTVVEIGPGAGRNLGLYRPGARWVGIEPNRFLHRHLKRESARVGLKIEILEESAEAMSLPDRSADAVVGTFVLCSVRDVRLALSEVRRILKPGGTYCFLEHVASQEGTLLLHLQRAVRPLWKALLDGCHPDRDTLQMITEAGFTDIQVESFRLPYALVGPHIAGSARNG